MNDKFTQGEWVAKLDDGYYQVSCGSWFVCTSFDTEQDKANARLIAAAPDMYRMIESLTIELSSAITEANLWRQRIINITTENQPDLIDGQTCHEAQLLLAKARGEK